MFNDSKSQIIKEISTAVNIKDKTNRKKVIISLKAIKNFLKKIKQNYVENGVVIFSGIDYHGENIFEYHFMSIPLKKGFYCCDKKFHIDFLEKYCNIENKDQYLIMYLTGTETFYYEKKLTKMKLLKKISFERQKKQKKGGQSQARIARLRVEKINKFANKSLEYLNGYQSNTKYKSVIIAGNGTIINSLKTNITSIKISSFQELVSKLDIFINNIDDNSGNSKIDEYMDMMNIGDEKLVYGGTYILDLMSQGLIKEILIHRRSKYYERFSTFNNKYIINNGTKEGDIFLKNFEGIFGKLYYKLDYIN